MATAKTVLLVDDDEALRGSLADQFDLHQEFETTQAGTGADALEIAKEKHFDAILLDVGLPDLDGREVCKLMRRQGVNAPIIMLTAQDTESDTILGLESGANDYVTKPFRLGVLVARLRAHLRQHEQSEDAVFTIGPYTFQPSAKILLDEEKGPKSSIDRKRNIHLEIPVPVRPKGRESRNLAVGSLGLQFRSNNAYA